MPTASRSTFASRAGPAPIIMVSGRMFPVEQRWKPFEESRDYGLNEAIADGVDELWAGGAGGDILVFLPGEREIREAADHLRGHLSHSPLNRGAEVLPLFARLSPAEQDHIFDAHNGRRIVLATNVAETSLTVPGIRYVIDAGTARVKRYSFRSKVEQLLVEPISQAAANQRAGRCGRVANGICIRLYDEKDFDGRPRFTDPEILRSSLAGVILRMKSLRLGVVEDFPFLDAPSGRAIADGYQLLNELGAVDDANELTPMGHELARLPLDPRVGRMILEARNRNALDEVLVIASALSVQDVRDRPMDAQQQADQAHAKFDDDKSEFTGYLKLWKWINEARGGAPTLPSARAQKEAARKGPVSQAVLPVAQRAAQAMAAARQALAGQGAGATGGCAPDAQAQQPAIRPRAAPELHQRAPAARMARHPHPAAYGGGRAQMEAQHHSRQLRAAAPVHAGRPAGQHRLEDGGGRGLSGCAGDQVLPPSRCAPVQETGALDRGGRTGGDDAAVRPRHRRHRTAMAGGGGWPPVEEAAAGSALGEEGRPGHGAGAGHAVRHRGLQRAAREFRHRRSARGARDLHSRGAGGRRVGHPAAFSGGQPEADRARRGTGAQVAPPGRAGRRRADLRLLRPAIAARGLQWRQLRSLVQGRGAVASPSC
jgi:hypothetical protein